MPFGADKRPTDPCDLGGGAFPFLGPTSEPHTRSYEGDEA